MRNVTKVLAIGGVASIILTGCGSSPTPANNSTPSAGTQPSYAGQTINVVFITSPPPTKLLDQFTQKTGIKVNWVNMGWDALQTKITAAASANTYFADATDVDWSRIGEYYRTKWFVPLNQYMDVSALQSDVPQLGSFMTHGQLIGMPVDASIMLTTVNKQDFAKAGITQMPTTFAEYSADLQKLQSSGVNAHPLGIPFAAAEGLSTYWYEVTGALGGSVLDSNFKPAFTDHASPGYQAMEWMVNAYKSGLVPKGNINLTDSEEMQSEMANHQISTIFSDYSGNVGTIYNVASASKVVNQVQYIPTPGANGGGPNLGNPDGLGIPKTAKNPGAAAEFIKWFSSTAVQADIAGANGSDLSILQWPFPMRLSAMKELTTTNDQVTQASIMYNLFQDHSKPIFPDGAPPWYGQFSNAVYTNIHSAALGQETVDQAVQAIANVVNQLNQ